ncbi:MAG: 5'-deoxynucleotidase [Clostridia bacterium]|nr:5'-deoxynucleotidase [Clostridia bacterium]
MEYGFFAFLSRVKYIRRWGLMRNTRDENLAEHTLETAMLSHALAIVGNRVFQKDLNADRAATLAIFHDATETITGDMPTPVKYFSPEIKAAFDGVDAVAKEKLLAMLPSELLSDYADVFYFDDDEYLKKLIKAADTLSAYIKCIEERLAGNKDFLKAERSIKKRLLGYSLPEVDYFLEKFIPAYEKTVDEI